MTDENLKMTAKASSAQRSFKKRTNVKLENRGIYEALI